jgi:hypothetical protein
MTMFDHIFIHASLSELIAWVGFGIALVFGLVIVAVAWCIDQVQRLWRKRQRLRRMLEAEHDRERWPLYR